MNAKHTERIGNLEKSLLPRAIISEWLMSLDQFEYPGQCLKDLLEGSDGTKLAALCLDLESSKGKGTDRTASAQTTPDLQHSISHWYFLEKLRSGLNYRARDLISDVQSRLDLTELTLQIKSLFPASNLTARWTDAIDLGEFAAHLVRARGYITWNLRALRSLRLTCDCISNKHTEGHDPLFKELAVELEKLHERTQESAHEYAQTLSELLSGRVPSDTQWPSDLGEIDFDAIEELAVGETDMIVRKLGDCAEAEMLIAFDKISEAREILKPYLEADVADLEEE